jgi:hypothetical protein
MRANHVIAVAIVLVCVGAKLTFLAAPIAEADSLSIAGASVDVSRMQQNIENLQVQEVHDMTFVFPSPALHHFEQWVTSQSSQPTKHLQLLQRPASD